MDFVSTFWALRRGEQIMPHLPLHTPIYLPSDLPHIHFFARVRFRLDTRQKQNRLLDIGGQVGQPHDLRHTHCGEFVSEFLSNEVRCLCR